VAEWDDGGPELEIIRRSRISEVVIETDAHVTVYGYSDVDLPLLAAFPDLRNVTIYMTDLDQGMSLIGPEEIYELDDECVGGWTLELDDISPFLTSLTIQPIHDGSSDFMKKLSVHSLHLVDLENLTIPQTNLLGQTLPRSLRTLSITEPTAQLQDWLSECVARLDSLPRLDTITVYSLDGLFISLPDLMGKACEERWGRSLTLLLRAPQTFRVIDGGTSIASC
jgi:hypothetical protein